jgi:hypothetical protein
VPLGAIPLALFVSLLLLVAAAKKAKNVMLVAGTQQNLSNLFLKVSMDIWHHFILNIFVCTTDI